MRNTYTLKSILLCLLVSFGAVLNANAQSGGIEVDADLGNGWSYSDVYGAFYNLGSGWHYSDWFGTFYTQDGSWFWRPGFGWTYLYEGASLGDWWLYVYELDDWCWTSDDVYPFVNSTNAGGFVWFDENILGFYNSDTGQYAAGGVHTVDFIISNSSLDQAAWDSIISQWRTSLAQTGYTNFYQFDSSSNSLILRFNFGSQAIANAVRAALQQAFSGDLGNSGPYTISVQ